MAVQYRGEAMPTEQAHLVVIIKKTGSINITILPLFITYIDKTEKVIKRVRDTEIIVIWCRNHRDALEEASKYKIEQ